jgi:hypothetical protein
MDIQNISMILYTTSNLFPQNTLSLFERLRYTNIDLTKFNIISVGDMAGNYVRGSDGNPTKFYE